MRCLVIFLAFLGLSFGTVANFRVPSTDSASEYGTSVAISGQLVVVGAPELSKDYANQGGAFVYTCTVSSCTLLSALTAFDAADYDNFGTAVAVDGTWVAVSAPSKTVGSNIFQGAVYVFNCPSTGCTLVAKVADSTTGNEFDDFGASVALSAGTLLVGADQRSVNGVEGQGEVYVYSCSMAGCNLVSMLDCPNCAAGDLFGASVALSGMTVIVGAPYNENNGVELAGLAVIFNCPTWSTCVVVDTVTAGVADALFGWSVAAAGSGLFVSAPFTGVGSVYSLTNGPSYQLNAIAPSDGMADDLFGYSISVSGTVLIVSSPGRTLNQNANSGVAYNFDCTDLTSCKQYRNLGFGDAPPSGDYFGASVSISAGFAVVGAPYQNSNTGALYYFSIPPLKCSPVTDASTAWSGAPVGTVTYGTCLTGFYGHPYRSCLAGAVLGPISKPCLPASCNAETYGHASWPAGTFGTVASGTCMPGYVGTPSRQCNNNGWSTGIINPCVVATCAASNDGVTAWPKTSVLQNATGVCQTGYYGKPTRSCLSNQQWGPVSNPCQVLVNCPAETYGHADFASTAPGATVTVSCNPGYSGTVQRTCQKTGVWQTLLVGKCNQITCPAGIYGNANFNLAFSGVQIYGTCVPGKVSTKRPYALCGLNGQWGAVINPCF